MSMPVIYIVEDDNNIRDLVVYTLDSTGFKAMGFPEGQSFMTALHQDRPDLVLLDIMLPGDDGIMILKKLRNDPQLAHIPAIMLTAKGAEFDKVQALDLGADDYVTKPFGMMELVSRIKAVLRRTMSAQSDSQTKQTNRTATGVADSILTRGPIRMDQARHQVTVDGTDVSLALKEYELLERLLRHPQMVLTRDQLLNDIWGYDFDGETRTVDVHVRKLRQKLGDAGDMIETVRGVGYRII